jgi:hypothetical protein
MVWVVFDWQKKSAQRPEESTETRIRDLPTIVDSEAFQLVLATLIIWHPATRDERR